MKRSDPGLPERSPALCLPYIRVRDSARAAESETAAANEQSHRRGWLSIGLVRLGLAAIAALSGSPWAIPLIAWILLAHLLVDEG